MFLKKLKDLLDTKNIKTNIFKIHADNSIMCGYFCIGFVDFMFAGRSLVKFTTNFKKND